MVQSGSKIDFLLLLFLSVFQDGRGKRFLCIFCVLRCIGRFFFDPFFEKVRTSIEKCRPTIFAYCTAFWLDFQGFGASKTWKKQQKRCLGNHGFLREWKSAPELGFSICFVIFGLHFGAPGRPKIEKIRLSLCFSVRRALWIVLGPLWPPFWSHLGHFEVIFDVFSKISSEVSDFV